MLQISDKLVVEKKLVTDRMTTIRRFCADDLFTFNNINLDPLTETYGLTFYLNYLGQFPDYCAMAESPTGQSMGYS